MSKCPACHKPLAKKYLRSLNPLEWEKLQCSYWMEAWHLAVDDRNALLREKNRKKYAKFTDSCDH